ncbi:MAG: DUF4124 domain-containing protein [Pseudoxanthomonas sp.]
MLLFRLLPLLLVLPLLPSPALAEDVTIYRCLGPGGALALRDSPCVKGETQQVRSMARPKDPAPGTVQVAMPRPPPPNVPVREVQVIYRTPPRPMYECVTDEDKRYVSDNGEGNPRLVPLWAAGYTRWEDGTGGFTHHRPPIAHGGLLPGAQVWVRDECHALPPDEVCARLSDRRYEIIRRYNSAMQSERRSLEVEQRGIDARIANDCGNP